MLIHELGHIAACRKFGIDHGEIGFGFYSIFPVVYANVTEIWTLDKHKRTIANLSGIYLELVYASICTLIFLFTKNMVFLAAAVSINIKTLTELNPFIRFDGYWVLSDLTNTPNLLPKANAAVKNFISKIKKRNKLIIGEWNLKNILLIFYGITNWVILVIYISWIISEKWQNILGFPLTIFISIKSIIYQDSETLFRNINFDNLIVLGFYLLVFKFLIEYLFKIYKTKRSLTNPDFNGLGQER
jgi:putative peptide zinc metalloprotease protein